MSGVMTPVLAALSGNDSNAPQIPNVPAPQIPYAADNTAPVAASAPEAPAAPVAAPAGPAVAPSVVSAAKAMQPGSFGHKLATALAVAHSVLATGMGGLGDAAAVGTVAPGQGTLAGVMRTLAAQRQRVNQEQQQQQQEADKQQERQDKQNQQAIENQREQDRTHALIASSNAQKMHETAATEQLGAESMARIVQSGKAEFDAMTDADQPAPAQVVQRDVTEGNLKNLLASNKVNGYENTAIHTGTRIVGTDPDTGQPKLEYTYSIIRVPDNYTIPDTDAGRAQAKKWSVVPGFESLKAPQTVTGAQAIWLNQQANNIATGKEIRETALNKAKLETAESAKKLEANQFTGNPDWINAVAQNNGNVVKAAQAMMNNKPMRDKYPNLLNDIYSQFASNKDATDGPQRFEQVRHEYELESEARQKTAALNVDQAGGIMTDQMKQQIAALPQQVQDGLAKLDPGTQGALLAVALGPGDYDFKTIFQRKYKGQTLLSPQEAIGWIKAINPRWEQGAYQNMQVAYKSIAPGTKTAQAIGQYRNVLQHASDAQDVIEDGRRNLSPKFLNTAINKLQTEGWGTYATELSAALTPVRNEFTQLMAGGYKPQEGEAEAYAQLFNPAATPNQLEVALKSIGRTGAIRLENINQEYASRTNRNIPGLLTNESYDAAKHLNLDPASMRILDRLDRANTLMYTPQYAEAHVNPAAVDTGDQQKKAVLSTIPAGAVAAVDKTGTIVGYSLNGKYVPLQGAGR